MSSVGELHRALHDIRNIRRQVAERTEFRGYGPAMLLSTALMAAVAAGVQGLWVADPAAAPARYLQLWIGTAVVGAGVSAIGVATRSRRMHSGLSGDMIGMAVRQFLPAVSAGLLLTVVLVARAPEQLWLLPGLWQIFFSLGIYASCRSLPRPMQAAAGWYMGSGLAAVALGAHALAPWVMGVGFGVGQALIAAVLYLHGAEEAADA
jgi:hypothetical protein